MECISASDNDDYKMYTKEHYRQQTRKITFSKIWKTYLFTSIRKRFGIWTNILTITRCY